MPPLRFLPEMKGPLAMIPADALAGLAGLGVGAAARALGLSIR